MALARNQDVQDSLSPSEQGGSYGELYIRAVDFSLRVFLNCSAGNRAQTERANLTGLKGKRSEFTNCQSDLELSIEVPNRKGLEKKIPKPANSPQLMFMSHGVNTYSNTSPNSGR